jgi:hypothetical protein
MFCPSCGIAVAPGLSFCNRCGSRLSAAPQKLADVTSYLTMATGFVTLGGLFLTFVFAKKFMDAGMVPWAVMTLGICGLLVTSVIAGLLIKQLSRVLGVYLQSSGNVTKESEPELGGRQTGQIEAPREPAFSVTDQTTRTFEPAYKEREPR